MLAHHYAAALDYARASGQDTTSLAERGRLALRDAGDRAFALNAFTAAARYYALAIESWPHDDPERPELVLKLARTYQRDADDKAQQVARGRPRGCSRCRPARAGGRGGRAARGGLVVPRRSGPAVRHLERARELVKTEPPSPWKAHVLSQVSRYRMLAGADEEAIRIGTEALHNGGGARARGAERARPHQHRHGEVNLGNAGGLEDLRRAAEIATASGSSEVVRAAHNLAVCEWVLGDLRQAILLMDDAIAHGERLGMANLLRFSQNVKHWMMFRTGDWDVALPYTDEVIAAIEAGEPHYHEGGMRMRRALVRLARDDVEGALDDLRKTVLLARQASDPQQRVPWLCESARLFVEAGELEEARRLAPEALQAGSANMSWALGELAYVARELECGDELAELLERAPPTTWITAAQALVTGDFGGGADLLEKIGDEELAALARLRAAEQLFAEGRRAEADEQLQRSLAFWRRVDASRYIRKAEALLAAAS